MNDPGPSSRPSLSLQPPASFAIDDDPFVSSTHIDTFRDSTATSESDYGTEPYVYTNHDRAGASTTSLISTNRESSTSTFDDSAHLTANMSHEPPHGSNWRTDSEDTATTPRTRRRTQRYSAELTPLSRSGTAIKSIHQGLRRISIRVVNFASNSLEDENHIRLGSDDGDERVVDDDDDGVEKVSEPPPESSSSVLPLRGRTLGYFGPTNRVRLAMYNFLIFRCVPCFCSYGSSDFLAGGQKSPFSVRSFSTPSC